jgi:GMP synthase-like glutamine amidotransferase
MTVLKIAVIENMAGVSAGAFGEALSDAGARLDVYRPYDGQALPQPDSDHDGLLVLGGLTNALNDTANPYFPALLDLIRDFHRADKPVLGICLGAQLVARAFGATLRLDGPIEFGFKPVERTTASDADALMGGLDGVLHVLQWHTDHYDLPDGATRLWHGDDYPNQAIRIGRATYAIQAHPEATRDMVEKWLEADTEIDRKVPDFRDWLPRQMDAYIDKQRKICHGLAVHWAGLARAMQTPLPR